MSSPIQIPSGIRIVTPIVSKLMHTKLLNQGEQEYPIGSPLKQASPILILMKESDKESLNNKLKEESCKNNKANKLTSKIISKQATDSKNYNIL